MLKCFTQWKVQVKYSRLKKGISPSNNDFLIEITNSRNSNNSESEIYKKKAPKNKPFGILSGGKNIKMKSLSKTNNKDAS